MPSGVAGPEGAIGLRKRPLVYALGKLSLDPSVSLKITRF